jgi:hypothetical protein
MMYQLNFFKIVLTYRKLLAIFGSPIFLPRILVFLSVFGVWEVEDWGQGDGLPRPHATSWKGDRSHRAEG